MGSMCMARLAGIRHADKATNSSSAGTEVQAKANFVTAGYEDEGFAKALEEHFLKS